MQVGSWVKQIIDGCTFYYFMLLKPETPRITAVCTIRMKSVGYISCIWRYRSETFLQIAGQANGTGTGVPHGTSVFLCQCHSTNTHNTLGKVIQMNQLDATMIY